MINKKMPNKFTLRKEYFGGLIYNSKTTKITILDKKEYKFLIELSSKNKISQKLLTKHKKLIKKLIALGVLKTTSNKSILLQNTRKIFPITNLKKNVLSAPIRVFDSYTRRCNFNCDHCYFTSSSFIEENRRTIKETKSIMRKFYNAGTMEWRFTGGEALIHKDLFEAIKTAKKYGMNVGIYSNGWWSDNIAKKVFNSKIDELTISLEGRKGINDNRRRKGAYKEIIKTFNKIYHHNKQKGSKKINVTIATAVGSDNISQIPFLAKLASSYDFNINFMPLKPSGRARYKLKNKMLNAKQYLKFSQAVQKMRENKKIKKSGIKIILKYKDLFNYNAIDKSSRPFPFNYTECGALTTAISMMPNGLLFSCPFILDIDTKNKFTGPNIKKTTVEKAWFHKKFQNYRNAIKKDCLDCKFYMKQCRGKCRATVLGFGGKIENGELVGKDPQCFSYLLD
jgi:radical SAM protein with 4Fe4S-binding SPASM domain